MLTLIQLENIAANPKKHTYGTLQEAIRQIEQYLWTAPDQASRHDLYTMNTAVSEEIIKRNHEAEAIIAAMKLSA